MQASVSEVLLETPRARAQGADAGGVRDLIWLASPLAMLCLLVRHFDLESPAFLTLMAVSTAGFVVHYLLPFPYRLKAFLLLSLSAWAYILGPLPAAWLIGLGLCLVVLCRLPVPFWPRAMALIAAGLGLLALRSGWGETPWPVAIWPILGSMFMFRLVAYEYDVRHTPSLASPLTTLSYFFMLPNVCFPLFPVVDYSTFCRTYYNEDRRRIHQVGVEWIFRGTIHLILYRAVYQLLVNDPAEVVTAVDLLRYMTWPFLLYLRVSGQFHIIVGILRLFGFNLPETHHAYFLASSFTDFWRRINIYWKDFMMKLFYYPAFFALRKRRATQALVVSTILVFVVTWALHTYQWFWIRGTWLLAWNDALFWGLLALLVLVNSLYEWKFGRQRSLTARTAGWTDTVSLTIRTVAMFVTMSLLWSLWSTESVTTWLSLWSAARNWSTSGPPWMLPVCLAVPCLVALCTIAASRNWLASLATMGFELRSAAIVAACGLLLALSTSIVYKRLGPAGDMIAALRYGGLNQGDLFGLERGYYENLVGDRLNGDLWSLYMNRPIDWTHGLVESGVARRTGGFLPYELLPSVQGRFKGVTLQTDRWGLHDKEYSLLPAPGTYRMAVLGASHAMGSGVVREETFEAVLEDRLNRHTDGIPAKPYEILNFAVYGYTPLHQIAVLDDKVPRFHPNAMLYVAHPEDAHRVVYHMVQMVRDGWPVPDDFLKDVIRRANVNGTMPQRVVSQRLTPHGDEVLAWLYHRLVADSRSRGICPGYVFMPMVPELSYRADPRIQLQLARDAGFTVFDLSHVYDGADRRTLWVAEWDAHPNRRAHAMMADMLYGQLRGEERSMLSCSPGN